MVGSGRGISEKRGRCGILRRLVLMMTVQNGDHFMVQCGNRDMCVCVWVLSIYSFFFLLRNVNIKCKNPFYCV